MVLAPMTGWIAAGVVFFAYVGAVSLLLGGLPPKRRMRAILGSLAGLVVCVAADWLPDGSLLRGWILPPAVLLLAYWISGLLYVAPMRRVELSLEAIDRSLSVDESAAATPRWLAEVLEAAYVGVYPLIPLALAISLSTSPDPQIDRFWTMILITDFFCFGFLPWIQTRPPRVFRWSDPWTATIRSFNLKLLGSTSIQANTFPSGHAAEALAVVLLIAHAPLPLVIWMGINAVLISAGAVLGRYHYAADVFAGWVVATGVWLAVR
jgi:membrane-associated phospholipid phosphatase